MNHLDKNIYMEKRKALITGISGQDGSILAEFLIKKNYIVYGLTRSVSNMENLSNIIEDKNLNIVYGDLMNSDLLRHILSNCKFDEVYNLASQSNVRLSYENPVLTFNVTLTGTILLIDSVKKYSPLSRIFQAGSSSMFGNSIDPDGYQRELTPFKPMSPYASAKLFAHNICQNYRENDKLYICNGILYNHESEKKKTMSGIINTVVQKAFNIKNGLEENFYISDIKIPIDCGYAHDYVEAMWLCLQQDIPDDYIIASGKTHTIEYICNYIFSKLQLNYKDYIKSNKTFVKIPELKGDSKKIKSIGWKPKHSFDDMLDNIIESNYKKYK
jgi:GDPmannose 4,6-dehydratase